MSLRDISSHRLGVYLVVFVYMDGFGLPGLFYLFMNVYRKAAMGWLYVGVILLDSMRSIVSVI